MMGAHRIDPQPHARLPWSIAGVSPGGEDGVLDRRQPGPLGDFGRDAKTDLVEPPRQMGGHAMRNFNTDLDIARMYLRLT